MTEPVQPLSWADEQELRKRGIPVKPFYPVYLGESPIAYFIRIAQGDEPETEDD